MKNLIKTPKQIKIMRENGAILHDMLQTLSQSCLPGTATLSLEEKFIQMCKKQDVIPACKGYTAGGYFSPFPTGLCVSINNQAVHCFPHKGQILKDGDIITIDTVIFNKGLHVDASIAACVGNVDKAGQNLVSAAKLALDKAIKIAGPGVRIGDVSCAFEQTALSNGCNVLKDYAGHGIGDNMHLPPDIPCYGKKDTGLPMEPGMTLCFESLFCEGSDVVDHISEWETRMHDGKRFAQQEHTVLITEKGALPLT